MAELTKLEQEIRKAIEAFYMYEVPDYETIRMKSISEYFRYYAKGLERLARRIEVIEEIHHTIYEPIPKPEGFPEWRNFDLSQNELKP